MRAAGVLLNTVGRSASTFPLLALFARRTWPHECCSIVCQCRDSHGALPMAYCALRLDHSGQTLSGQGKRNTSLMFSLRSIQASSLLLWQSGSVTAAIVFLMDDSAAVSCGGSGHLAFSQGEHHDLPANVGAPREYPQCDDLGGARGV